MYKQSLEIHHPMLILVSQRPKGRPMLLLVRTELKKIISRYLLSSQTSRTVKINKLLPERHSVTSSQNLKTLLRIGDSEF